MFCIRYLIPFLAGVLFLYAFSCTQRNVESENEKDAIHDSIKDIEITFSLIDSLVLSDSSLYNFEFNIIGMSSEKDAALIDKALAEIKGLRGIQTSYESATCLVYADSLKMYKNVINAIRGEGFELEEIFSMGGPRLTCNIPPSNQGAGHDSTNLIFLDKSIEPFRKQFNKMKDKTRIITIPNPSCLSCVKGQRAINELIEDEFLSTNSLVAFTVWISINGWGKVQDAKKQALDIYDDRVQNFWDPNMDLGKLFKEPLGLNPEYTTAWDVYLIYEPGLVWENDTPPQPTFWMHKLEIKNSGAKERLFFNKKTFGKKLTEIANGEKLTLH